MPYNPDRNPRRAEYIGNKPFLRVRWEHYDKIKAGLKTLEIRKEHQVSNINVGQTIVLGKSDEYMEIKVVAKTIYRNKQEALDKIDLQKALPGASPRDAAIIMEDIFRGYTGKIVALEVQKIQKGQQELT